MDTKKKIVIFKNDRGGDLFISLKVISTLRNEFQNITIFLSQLNCGFKFLFNLFNIKKINFDLSIPDKIKIIYFLYKSNIDSVYILTPKNFYFYLPLIFRRIRFYAVTINGDKRNRPPLYLRKLLYNYVEISRSKIINKKPSRDLQLDLLETIFNVDHEYKNLTIPIINNNQRKLIPQKYIYIQFKKKFFEEFGWGIAEFTKIIKLLSSKYENILFSSDIEKNNYNDFFLNNFSIIDFNNNKVIKLNDKKVYFLNNINAKELFIIINAADKCISPHGLVTNICYFLNKNSINLFNYQSSNFDYHPVKISFSEWYGSMKINFLFLKKDISKSLNKINKYL
jgi:ADP-heptose:LPS heptosyltransferase